MSGRGHGPVIGIDIGTTYIRVGVCKKDDGVVIISTIPCYVAFAGSECLIGDEAKNQLEKNPTNTVFGFKRLIGRRFSDATVQGVIRRWPFKVVPGKDDKPLIEVEYKGKKEQYSAEDILSMMLTKVKDIAKDHTGATIKFVVITVPAVFNQMQRRAAEDAAVKAGLRVLRVLNEPIAAAIAYGFDRKADDDKDKNVLVFDLGGGTFDVSVITVNDKGASFRVKATAGDTHLGGEDIDDCVLDYLVNQIRRKYNKDIVGDRKAVRMLRDACEASKRSLSKETAAAIRIDSLLEDLDVELVLSRDEFDSLTLNQDLFGTCMDLVNKCLADAKMQRITIDDIVLVGGSSRIVEVKRRLMQGFFAGEVVLYQSGDPDEDVARGAVVYAASLSGGDSPTAAITCFGATPFSLGLETSGGVMSVVVERKASYPTTKEKVFSTCFDDQGSVLIQVYEGEGTRTRMNKLLGNFVLSGIGPAPKGVPRITVIFDIDWSGMLNVSAECNTNGQKSKMIINRCEGSSLKEEEVANMAVSAEYTGPRWVGHEKNLEEEEEHEKKLEGIEKLAFERESEERSVIDAEIFGERFTRLVEGRKEPPIQENKYKAICAFTDYCRNLDRSFKEDSKLSSADEDAVNYRLKHIQLALGWRNEDVELPEVCEIEDRRKMLQISLRQPHQEHKKLKAKTDFEDYCETMQDSLWRNESDDAYGEAVEEQLAWSVALDDHKLPEVSEFDKRRKDLDIILKPFFGRIKKPKIG